MKVRFNDFKTYTRAKSLDEFTDSEPEIRRAAFDCLNRFELNKEVRLIGFRVSNLQKKREMKKEIKGGGDPANKFPRVVQPNQ